MIALLLCIVGFVAAYIAGRRSLGAGCVAVLAAGYGYGILRANLQTPASHFIFDAALLGLYASHFLSEKKKEAGKPRDTALRYWLLPLIGWPMFVLFLSFQPLLVSIVGLRTSIMMLPAILLGARLRSADLRVFALSLAALNLVALGFGIAESIRGIEPFFPLSPVTVTIYGSQDSGNQHRIPSTFQHAHAYAGMMVATLPFLFGCWARKSGSRKENLFLLLGIGAALFGVLMSATRTGIVSGCFMAFLAFTSGRMGAWKRWVWVAGVAGVIFSAMQNDRWQRYRQLDPDTVTERVAGSVNRSFFEILEEYPMGNGLGGGGTNVPYFLAYRVNSPVGAENEYAHILLEQGIIGLLIWVAFVLWFLTNRSTFVKDEWFTGRRMGWYLTAFGLLSAVLGVGLLSAIPGTFAFLLTMGWTAVKPQSERQRAFSVMRTRALTARSVVRA